MTVLTRDDKVQFVTQPYRELLNYRSAALIRKEIHYLAQQNGRFVRLFKQADGRFEAVFSREAGYLIAESIWQHFGKPADLIYCEELADKRHALVVIIRSSNILYDAKLPIATLAEELSALLTLKNKFNIYVYGKISLSEENENNKVAFDTEKVLSFTRLEKPVYPNLELYPEAELRLVEDAICEHHFGRPMIALATAALLSIVVCCVLANHFLPSFQETSEQARFYSQFEGSHVSTELPLVATDIVRAYKIPGWLATHIESKNGSTHVKVHSLGGTVASLMQWASQQKIEVTLNSEGASLLFTDAIPEAASANIVDSQKVITAEIIDSMMQLLPGRSVQIRYSKQIGSYNVTELAIQFTNISPSTLVLIGKTLKNIPTKLESVQANIDDGLLTGAVVLSVYGK